MRHRSAAHTGECHPVGNAQPPGVAMAPLGSRRQEGGGRPLPQVVGIKIGTHPGPLADQDRRAQDPQLNSFGNDQLLLRPRSAASTSPRLCGLTTRCDFDPEVI